MPEPISEGARFVHFWTPDVRAADAVGGIYEKKEFPEAHIISLRPLKLSFCDILYGVVDSKTFVTMFDTTTTISSYGWRNFGRRIDKQDLPSDQYAVRVVANFAVESPTILQKETTIFRVDFESEVLGDMLFRLTRAAHNHEHIVLAAYNRSNGAKIRIYRNPVNNTARVAYSHTKDLLSPKQAYQLAFRLRLFLCQTLGHIVDVRRVRIYFGSKKAFFIGDLIFPDFPSIKDDRELICPLIDFARRPELLERLFSCWLTEGSVLPVARHIFVEVLQTSNIVVVAQLKELMTAVEMLVRSEERLIEKVLFKLIKEKLNETIDIFAASNDCPQISELKEKVVTLNDINAKETLRRCILALGQGFIDRNLEDVDIFVEQVIKTRNKATHDASKMSNDDFLDMPWLVTKLKAVLALYFLCKVGIDPSEAHTGAQVLARAEAYGKKPPSRMRAQPNGAVEGL